MRDVLQALADGELSVAEAEVAISGYATTDAGRFDAARETRRGVPEAILGDGKTPGEVAELATTALETAGRAIVTRVDRNAASTTTGRIHEEHPEATVTHHERASVLVAHATDFDAPDFDATVAVVSAGTSDAQPVGEVAVIAAEMGATVVRVTDVGVAALSRIVDHIDEVRDADVAVVAAGREGALPTVVAGLVDTPIIGLPVSTGYGHGGEGEAALLGMLQSCSVLSVVNIDAGFVAGAQAGLVARAVAGA